MTDDNDKRNAETYLETCASGYVAAVQAGDVAGTAAQFDDWNSTKAALHDAGIRLAAAPGNVDAAERAELTALRRFREGVEGLRVELAQGYEATGEVILKGREHAIETIDALLYFAAPNDGHAKEHMS